MRTAILLLLLFFTHNIAHAQWKRTASRTITWIESPKDHSDFLRDVTRDSMLVEMIMRAVAKGKIPAYESSDVNFETKLPEQELKMIFADVSDTEWVVDPIDGTETMRIKKREFEYRAFTHFKTIEDWQYIPETKETKMTLAGIVIVQDVYDETWQFRGRKDFIAVRYTDILPIIERYQQRHPNNLFAFKIWQDHFEGKEKPAPVKD